MPGIVHEPSAEGLTVKGLHPTFGAEIEGVDFENLSDAQFAEVKDALAKVRSSWPESMFGFLHWWLQPTAWSDITTLPTASGA